MYIFLARNNVQAGPYSLEQVNQMLATGQVALDDLMWHEGMATWQTVGEMTQNTFVYRPTIVVTHPTNTEDEDYIINNTPDTTQTPTPTAPESDSKKDAASTSVWDKYINSNPHKSSDTARKSVSQKPNSHDISQSAKQLDLASISSRIIAKLIDTGLFLLATMPFFVTLYHSPMFEKLKSWAQAGQTRLTTEQQMEIVAALPQHILLVSNIMIWGLIILQLFLLLRRGQTIGKMAMGIRILDKQSNAIPKFFNLIILRSLLMTILYSLSLVGLFILIADLVTMLSNPERESLHDKLAKTYVVRADDTQTTPLELTPDA